MESGLIFNQLICELESRHPCHVTTQRSVDLALAEDQTNWIRYAPGNVSFNFGEKRLEAVRGIIAHQLQLSKEDTLMTSIKKLTVAMAMIVSLLSLNAYAQSLDPELNHLATGGISFDYPAGYAVTDKRTPEVQEFVITRQGSSIQLTIIAMRHLISPNELQAAIEDFKEPIIKKVEATLSPTNSLERTEIKSQLGSREAEGVRLQSLDNRMRTGEVIWLHWNSRLVALSFVRVDADEEAGAHLWETIRSSLRVATPVVTVIGQANGASTTEGSIVGGVLNGKAIVLPKPAYPPIARAAHASGTVVVQVLIDEEGNVVSAHAVSGHPLLQAASVAAAREAKFSPTTLAGQRVKVTGVIQYNFVAAPPPPPVQPPGN